MHFIEYLILKQSTARFGKFLVFITDSTYKEVITKQYLRLVLEKLPHI